jgi:hypothetical protein
MTRRAVVSMLAALAALATPLGVHCSRSSANGTRLGEDLA